MDDIKLFLYLDEYKMYSISSQIFEGITEYLIDYKSCSTEESEEQKGPIASGRIMADILKAEAKTQEKRYLHDYSYKLFEAHLKDNGKIESIDNHNVNDIVSTISAASFVKVKGKIVFNDINLIKTTINRFNEIGAALSHITNFGNIEQARHQLESAAETIKDRNQKAKLKQRLKSLTNIQGLAKQEGLQQDPQFLKNLALVLEYGFQDQFEVQLPIAGHIFTANLKRDHLRESEQMLVRKYSRFSEREFVVFGTVAQSSNTPPEVNKDEPSVDFHNIKEALMFLVEKLSAVEGTFSGRLSNEVIIDPIAIYQEV